MTIEEILNILEEKHNRYFYYRNVTKDLRGKQDDINIHSIVWITNDGHCTGMSLNDGFTQEDAQLFINRIECIIQKDNEENHE